MPGLLSFPYDPAMAQRRHHYEAAFEAYLRDHRVPYISIDEARRALLPRIAPLQVAEGPALKAFDFVVYGGSENLLLEIKGRRLRPTRSGSARLECWVTNDDVHSLRAWSALFGPDFRPAFVFVYWCDEQPPDALFQELFRHKDRWYALRSVALEDYAGAMRPRSPKWGTVDLRPRDFEMLSHPFCAPAGLASQTAPLASLEPIGA